MSAKSFVVIAGFAALALVGTAPPAAAQSQSPTGQGGTSLTLPRTHPRIEIYPRQLLYRRCTDWYQLQPRPSGTVLYPRMRCWWVRG
jgi:hypothetical protein